MLNTLLFFIGLAFLVVSVAGGPLLAIAGIWIMGRAAVSIYRGDKEYKSKSRGEKIASWILLLIALSIPAGMVLYEITGEEWMGIVLSFLVLTAFASLPITAIIIGIQSFPLTSNKQKFNEPEPLVEPDGVDE